MINILVPTDLSPLSKVAIKYAVSIANRLNGNITLIHIIGVLQPTRATLGLLVKSIERQLTEAAKEDLTNVANEISMQLKDPQSIRVKIVKGNSFNLTVKREAKKLNAGLIVMGTRGASGLKKYVIGSNTASVIEVSDIPVLAVPENGDFTSFRNVVYASDLKHLEKELAMLMPYLKLFDSTVHLIHITSSLKGVSDLERSIKARVQAMRYENVIVKVIVNRKIDEAIDYYVRTKKVDVLAMFTHDPTFYEKVFDRSMTRKMAFHSKVPLLAINQR